MNKSHSIANEGVKTDHVNLAFLKDDNLGEDARPSVVSEAKPERPGLFADIRANHAQQMKVHGAEQFNRGSAYGYELAKSEALEDKLVFGAQCCLGTTVVAGALCFIRFALA